MGTPPENMSEGDWWRRVVELAALVTVPPAMLYVLGLAAFWLGLSSEYENAGLYATWYAVSLVPKTAAAGYGVGVVWKGLIAALLTTFVLLFLAYWPLRWRAAKNRQVAEHPLWAPAVVPLGAVLVAALLWVAGSTEAGTLSIYNLRLSGTLLASYLLLLYLWRLGEVGRETLRKVFSFYPKQLRDLVALVALLCLGFSILFPGEVRLPCLWREPVEGDVVNGEVLSPQRAEELDDLRMLEGGFLTRAEGRWYVFDKDTLDLKAIPDDEAPRILRGEFYTTYQEISKDGKPVGEPVPEDQMRPGGTFIISGACT